MIKPIRLQLSRRAGFNLQRLSIETNGLPAVNVARPGKWGNPYPVGEELESVPFVDADYPTRHFRTAEEAVECIRTLLTGPDFDPRILKEEWINPLRGKNLACWCKPGAPCHADVLLALANNDLPLDAALDRT